MSTTIPKPPIAPSPAPAARGFGPIGRLGRYAATHARTVFIAWAVIAVAFGFFAPRVETALSGAGWQANGSESVQVRDLVKREFGGLNSTGLMVVVHSPSQTTASPAFQRTVLRVAAKLKTDGRVASVTLPQAGQTISRDGHTAIVMAGAKADANTMVRAADDLKGPVTALGTEQVQVALTGASGMWSDFNEANRSAMMRSELFSLAGDARHPGARVRVARRRRASAAADDARPAGLGRLAVPAHQGLADLDLGDELRADVRAGARASTTPCSSSSASATPCSASTRTASMRSRRPWTPPARPSCSAA